MPQPVAVFLSQSQMLKTAIADCLDKPKPNPVHRLRSTTRRLEATLELLAASAGIPRLQQKSRPLIKSLRRIRRAAGKVRDRDVHRELLGVYKTSHDAARLDKDLAAVRKKSALRLQKRLLKEQSEIQRGYDDLESLLQPVLDLNVSGGALADVARSRFAAAARDLDPRHDDELHSIRKACKTARYLAEIGSDTSKVAATLSARLERLQQTTGAWHDHLLLLNEAQASLPEDSLLIRQIRAEAERLCRRAESMAKRMLATT